MAFRRGLSWRKVVKTHPNDPDFGVVASRVFTGRTAQQADAAAASYLARMAGYNPRKASQGTLLTDWAARWLEDVRTSRSASTYRRYAAELDRWLDSLPPGLWVEDVTATYAEDLPRRSLAVVRSCLGAAAKAGLVRDNPLSSLDSASGAADAPLTWSPEQLESLVAYLRADRNHWLTAWVLTQAHTGARVGEMRALRWQDVDEARGVVTLRRLAQEIYGRHGAGAYVEPRPGREVPVPQRVLDALQRHREVQGTGAAGLRPQWVFAAPMGGLMSQSNLQCRVWAPAVRDWASATGHPYLGPHCLRHYFGRTQLASGVPLEAVSNWLGHSDCKVTEKMYLRA